MKTILLTIFTSLICIANVNAQLNMQDSINMDKTWIKFRAAFTAMDLTAMKLLTATVVYCSDCYDNTQTEKERNEKLMRTDKWVDFMETAYYIPQSKFIKEDVPIMSKDIGNLMLTKPFQISEDFTNVEIFTNKLNKKQLNLPTKIFNIVITLVEPNTEYDGLQAIFTFVKTKNGFLFCGYSTVP